MRIMATLHETPPYDTTTAAPVVGDNQLVDRVLQGATHAFEQIMRRYNQRLYRVAVGVLADASEAQDVLQESYIKAFAQLASLGDRDNLGPWLARIVRNEAIDRLRARNARHKNFPLEADLMPEGDDDSSNIRIESVAADAYFNPETLVARATLTRVLEEAVQALPEQFRSVFILREVEGLSIKEAAQYLDIPEATVKTRDHRARALLQARLDKRIDSATKEAFAFMGANCDAIVANVLARLP